MSAIEASGYQEVGADAAGLGDFEMLIDTQDSGSTLVQSQTQGRD